MTNEFELADHTRASLIYEKQDLLAPMLPGMLAPPHPMVEGTNEKHYYRGQVTQATPGQEAWVARRHGTEEAAVGADLTDGDEQ